MDKVTVDVRVPEMLSLGDDDSEAEFPSGVDVFVAEWSEEMDRKDLEIESDSVGVLVGDFEAEIDPVDSAVKVKLVELLLVGVRLSRVRDAVTDASVVTVVDIEGDFVTLNEWEYDGVNDLVEVSRFGDSDFDADSSYVDVLDCDFDLVAELLAVGDMVTERSFVALFVGDMSVFETDADLVTDTDLVKLVSALSEEVELLEDVRVKVTLFDRVCKDETERVVDGVPRDSDWEADFDADGPSGESDLESDTSAEEVSEADSDREGVGGGVIVSDADSTSERENDLVSERVVVLVTVRVGGGVTVSLTDIDSSVEAVPLVRDKESERDSVGVVVLVTV